MIPVVAFVGPSGVGKTTVLEGLFPHLKDRGLKVAFVKHHRGDFDIDKPGKDTWRMGQAGAAAIAISSPKKLGIIRRVDRDLALEEILPHLGGPDLVLAEGYKNYPCPKIQVFRRGFPTDLLAPPGRLLAAVADWNLDLPVPIFSFSAQKDLARFLVQMVQGDDLPFLGDPR